MLLKELMAYIKPGTVLMLGTIKPPYVGIYKRYKLDEIAPCMANREVAYICNDVWFDTGALCIILEKDF